MPHDGVTSNHIVMPQLEHISGPLGVRKTAGEITTKLSNPTHDMHDIDIHAACMPSVQQQVTQHELYKRIDFIASAKLSRHSSCITSRDHMTVIQHYIKQQRKKIMS